MKKINTRFLDFIKENQNKSIEIEITKAQSDERSNRKPTEKYEVNYQVTIDGNIIEIEGMLIPYHSGRSEDYEFEPGYFMDQESEDYYSEHWEEIEEQILDKFYKGGF